jgi:hypothetical protein
MKFLITKSGNQTISKLNTIVELSSKLGNHKLSINGDLITIVGDKFKYNGTIFKLESVITAIKKISSNSPVKEVIEITPEPKEVIKTDVYDTYSVKQLKEELKSKGIDFNPTLKKSELLLIIRSVI